MITLERPRAASWMARRTDIQRTLFGAWLNQARADKGWTMERLAQAADVTHAYISRMESRPESPSRQLIERIAAALGVDAAPGLLAAGFLPEGYEAAPKGEVIGLSDEHKQLIADYNNADDVGQQVARRVLTTSERKQVAEAIEARGQKNLDDFDALDQETP